MSINCIRSLLEDAVETHGEKPALLFNGRAMSYSELASRVNQVACYLDELGLPKNSRIGVYSNKCMEQVIYPYLLLTSLTQCQETKLIICNVYHL